MIRLYRPACPAELTEEVKQELTKKFIHEKENVWSKPYIKSALLEMSYNKCAYCECKLDEESKYMEVEHFFPKDDYPNLVVEWDNLLPSCKRCNVRKKKHDPAKEPIINPVIDDPNNHIEMYNYWIKGKDEKGKMTVEVLYLNQIDRVVRPRMEIGAQTIGTIEKLLEQAEKIEVGCDATSRNKNRVVNGTIQLLTEAQPQSEYSSTVATILYTNADFFKLRDTMIKSDLWDEELEVLLSIAEKNTLAEPLHRSSIA